MLNLPPNVHRVIYIFDVSETYAELLCMAEDFYDNSLCCHCPKPERLVEIWFIHWLFERGHMVVDGHNSYFELWNYGLYGSTALTFITKILKGNQRLIAHFHDKIRIAMEHSSHPVRMRLTSRTLTLILDVGTTPHANHHPLT